MAGFMRTVKSKVVNATYKTLLVLPSFRFVKHTNKSELPITFKMWFMQKVLGFNKQVYWPVHFTSKVNVHQNIIIGKETYPGYEPGCYIQGLGKIYIGNYVQIAQNVGIVSANHNLYDNSQHEYGEEVRIGNYCWLGMGCVILPGVTLGDFTVVGANAVVTKSFPEGHCLIAGNPARKIKDLEPEKCHAYERDVKYIGYVRVEKFPEFRKKHLWI
jgi:acetyltransferase-like isoleucine patch superfamily enzyme